MTPVWLKRLVGSGVMIRRVDVATILALSPAWGAHVQVPSYDRLLRGL